MCELIISFNSCLCRQTVLLSPFFAKKETEVKKNQAAKSHILLYNGLGFHPDAYFWDVLTPFNCSMQQTLHTLGLE